MCSSAEKQCHQRVTCNNSAKDEGTDNVSLAKSPVPTSQQSVRGSGHILGKSVTPDSNDSAKSNNNNEEEVLMSGDITSHEQLMALKYKKKLITTATEQFNTKPAKGVAYLQEMGLIKTPMDPVEVAQFMRTNPHLDKKQLGDYISNRKNANILEAFVQSFDFSGLRLDESLRMFLECFR